MPPTSPPSGARVQITPTRVLVIGLRRLGDLLLATALIRSVKSAWPAARIDVLLPAGNESMLEGNADVAEILSFTRGKTSWTQLHRLARRYELSVGLQPDDRAQFFALLASSRRASIVPPAGQPGAAWKRGINQYWTPVSLHTTHIVLQYLQLADALGIPRRTALVPPRARAGLGPAQNTHGDYAVIHPAPLYRYKAWTIDGWRTLIRRLSAQGLRVMVSGGPAETERTYVAEVLGGLDLPDGALRNLAGRLSFAELTPLLENARVFVGPDTSVTHLAAACTTPTVALFGPSSPVAWGPWPQGWRGVADSPWILRAPVQRVGNVCIVQGTTERYAGCVPCLQEGCERHVGSISDCLDQLSAARVIAAVDQMSGSRAPM